MKTKQNELRDVQAMRAPMQAFRYWTLRLQPLFLLTKYQLAIMLISTGDCESIPRDSGLCKDLAWLLHDNPVWPLSEINCPTIELPPFVFSLKPCSYKSYRTLATDYYSWACEAKSRYHQPNNASCNVYFDNHVQ